MEKRVKIFGAEARAPSSRETYCGASRLRSECTLGSQDSASDAFRQLVAIPNERSKEIKDEEETADTKNHRCTKVSQSVHLIQRIIVARPFAG
ncbi:hypothetical protein TNCV_841451 [Trichonephila clavipes]|nr:hypothetical protein TNCV_841451 [Trichonephila clavipes]